MLTQINACGLCPHSRKPGKGLINTDKMKRATPLRFHYSICIADNRGCGAREFRGKTKFKIDGNYFQTLGEEYSWQKPIYIVRTFPEHLKNPDGRRAHPKWTGGLLGVTKEQMEDFNDFHKKWYLEDIYS